RDAFGGGVRSARIAWSIASFQARMGSTAGCSGAAAKLRRTCGMGRRACWGSSAGSCRASSVKRVCMGSYSVYSVISRKRSAYYTGGAGTMPPDDAKAMTVTIMQDVTTGCAVQRGGSALERQFHHLVFRRRQVGRQQHLGRVRRLADRHLAVLASV